MLNEIEFFKELLKLEKIQHSTPLTEAEIGQLVWDVANGRYEKPVLELTRRIEQAHGIGVYHE
jgi:hypothetical protein